MASLSIASKLAAVRSAVIFSLFLVTPSPSQPTQGTISWSEAILGLRLGTALDVSAAHASLHVLLDNVGLKPVTVVIGENAGIEVYSIVISTILPDGSRVTLYPKEYVSLPSMSLHLPILLGLKPGDKRDFWYSAHDLVYYEKSGPVTLETLFEKGCKIQATLEIVMQMNTKAPLDTRRFGKLTTPPITVQK